jgi:hypothetical protein
MITRDQIEQLEHEAAMAGDEEMVSDCRSCLSTDEWQHTVQGKRVIDCIEYAKTRANHD